MLEPTHIWAAIIWHLHAVCGRVWTGTDERIIPNTPPWHARPEGRRATKLPGPHTKAKTALDKAGEEHKTAPISSLTRTVATINTKYQEKTVNAQFKHFSCDCELRSMANRVNYWELADLNEVNPVQ